MRVQGRQREHSMHFSEHQHPFGPERWVNRWRASLLSPFGHSHCCCRHRSALFESTFLHPFAPSPLRDFFAPMGALTPAQPGSSGRSSMNSGSFSEQLSLIHASGLLDHSVSTHLMRHCRRFLTLPFSSTASRFRSRLRPCIAGSPITPGRIEFVILRTGRSPPAAPHHASLRRSCIRLQAGERMPEEDLHLSDHLRFQAHDATALPRGGFTLAAAQPLTCCPRASSVNLHGARPWHPNTAPTLIVATNVNLHGARPWHPNSVPTLIVATNVNLHGARPWHRPPCHVPRRRHFLVPGE
jgi:hypothetical protein